MEVVPGLWPTGATDHTVFVVNTGVMDTAVTNGEVVGVVGPVRAQTRVCQDCGAEDTDAWEYHGEDSAGRSCAACKTPYPGGPSACRECGSGRVAVLGYAGCSVCCANTPLESFDIATEAGDEEEEQEFYPCIESSDDGAGEPQLSTAASCLELDAEACEHIADQPGRIPLVAVAGDDRRNSKPS